MASARPSSRSTRYEELPRPSSTIAMTSGMRPPPSRPRSRAHGVVGVRSDVVPDEVVGDALVGVMLVGVGPTPAEELLVVGGCQRQPAWTRHFPHAKPPCSNG